MKYWTFILFYLFLYKKSLQWKLKVKNKTSKKFKKGISFVFTVVDLHCKQQIEVLVRLMSAVNLSIIRWFKIPLSLHKNGPILQISVHPTVVILAV